MSKAERLLRELIALPSVNPAFLPVNDPRASEKHVGDFLAAKAAKTGLDVVLQPALPHRSNLLAALSPRGKPNQRILLAPHLDTIGAEDGQFIPNKKNGRIYGRGACDAKGPVAAMFTAMCELAESRRPAQ